MKTIAQILKNAKLGQLFSDGKRVWKVTDENFDGAVVASPVKGKPSVELWSKGIEQITYMPELRRYIPNKKAK
jgi:hypothetical protein